jgi:hypothetical protein
VENEDDEDEVGGGIGDDDDDDDDVTVEDDVDGTTLNADDDEDEDEESDDEFDIAIPVRTGELFLPRTSIYSWIFGILTSMPRSEQMDQRCFDRCWLLWKGLSRDGR